MRIGFSMPAYNEELLLEETVRGLTGLVDRLVIVNDGSKDQTGAVADRLAKELPWVSVIHQQNTGVGGAVLAGIRKLLASGECDAIGIIGSDNQCDPSLVPIFRWILDSQPDVSVAKGSRFLHPETLHNMPRFRYWGNRGVSAVMQIVLGYWGMSDVLHGYLLARTAVFRDMDLDSIAAGYDLENTMMAEFRRLRCAIALVPSPSRYGRERSSIVLRTQIPKTLKKTAAILLRRLTQGSVADRLTPALGVLSGSTALASVVTLNPLLAGTSTFLAACTAASLRLTSPPVRIVYERPAEAANYSAPKEASL